MQGCNICFILTILFLSAFVANGQFEGDYCTRIYDRAQGICRRTSQCPQVIRQQQEYRIPITSCGFNRERIICCPLENTNSAPIRTTESPIYWDIQAAAPTQRPTARTTQRITTQRTTRSQTTQAPRRTSNARISEQKCEEYKKYVTVNILVSTLTASNKAPSGFSVTKCDFTLPLVVGGSAAAADEFPHMVAIGWTNKLEDEITFDCGGSLISERFVLSAAHCQKSTRDGGIPDTVRLGEINILKSNRNSRAIDYKVDDMIRHPNYKLKKKYYDIALIRLATEVAFSKYIRPACLWQSANVNSTKSVAIGFGTTGYMEEKTGVLLKVGLDVINNQECSDYHDSEDSLDQGIVNAQMCAGVLTGGKDTCGGDSGGPLMITTPDNPCVFHIVGVTSFGSRFCGGKKSPGVYTRVSSYLNWIESIVWPQ